MGKGDIKTRKGKIARSSYGLSRPHPTRKLIVSIPETKPKD
ncbi:30S ribosomal protein THX [Spirosoma jeollabukense]